MLLLLRLWLLLLLFSSSLLFLLLGFFFSSLFSVINGCLLFRCIMPLKLQMVLCCEYIVIISGNCCCVNGYYCFAQNMNRFCFVKLLLFFFSFSQIIFLVQATNILGEPTSMRLPLLIFLDCMCWREIRVATK